MTSLTVSERDPVPVLRGPGFSGRSRYFITSAAVHAVVIGLLSTFVILPRAKRTWEAEILMAPPAKAAPAAPVTRPPFTKEPKILAISRSLPARPDLLPIRRQPLRPSPECIESAPSVDVAPAVSTPVKPVEVARVPGQISLDSFRRQILSSIERAKRYPRIASRMGLEGTVEISFLLTREGEAVDVEVVESSGYAVLDQGGSRAVREASFPPIPDHFSRDSMRYTVSIRFSLVDR